MSMTPRSMTLQLPFEFGKPIDPGYNKVLQSRIRALLHPKAEGFPGSYPVNFEPFHLQQLINEEYFVTEKFASVRCMLLSTNTPKGPACFLIDRHNEISFVPNLLLPLRDNPTKYQHETLLDGEMVTEHDGQRTILRFLMLDQDILGVHNSKPNDVKSKEPFLIERKSMQRSYGLNIILSGSRKQKQGAEGLIFVPVKQPYVAGISPKLLKWKSHMTAQFQIKVTMSKERKPLYCIHVRQGPNLKFNDYVTPDSTQAAEWHTTSPDGKIAEFWWDAHWQTQMFEKGYGLETRTGGWRFNRVREDKKDIDEESTVALVKSLDNLVTREQLEGSIDQIRKQWKAREAGAGSNGMGSHSLASGQRPPMRPLSISSSASSHTDAQTSLPTPAIGSHYLQSPSVASHSSSQGYFSRKERERKQSTDEQSSSISAHTSASGMFSHPLPPKPPPYQPRQSPMDQSQPCSPNPPGAGAKVTDQEQHASSPSSASSVQLTQNIERKSTPPIVSSLPAPTTTASIAMNTSAVTSPSTLTTSSTSTTTLITTITPSVTSAPATTLNVAATPISSPTPTTTPTSSTTVATAMSPTNPRNPHKLSQIPAHLQPTKPWMTVAPVPRTSLSEKATKFGIERRDSKDSSIHDTPQRLSASSSRKSSVISTDGAKDSSSNTTNASTKSQESKNSTNTNVTASGLSATLTQERAPQTPTPAQTPTISGNLRTTGIPLLPTTASIALPNTALSNVTLPNIVLPNIALSNITLPNIALPNTLHRDMDEKIQDSGAEATSATKSNDSPGVSPTTSQIVKPMRNPSLSDINSTKPSPVLGKRTVASTSSAGARPDDSLAQRRKLSDGMQPSPKSEAVTTGIGSLNLASTLSPKSINMSSFSLEGVERSSPLLSPLSSPGITSKSNDSQQYWSRSQQTNGPRALKTSNLAHEAPTYTSQISVYHDVVMTDDKDNVDRSTSRCSIDESHGDIINTGTKGDVEMEDASEVEQKDIINTSTWAPLPQHKIIANGLIEDLVESESKTTQISLTSTTLSRSQLSPSFVMAAQTAYDNYEDQEKAKAMAIARATASSKLVKELELKNAKEKRLLEDIERFKESSKLKKEKSTKPRTRDMIEPSLQDRRAQPIRQINQQQGKQSYPDSPSSRSHSQVGQRIVSSPHEQQQRSTYITRQSRSSSRADSIQSAPSNPKTLRQEQQLLPVEHTDPTGGRISKEQSHKDQYPGDHPDLKEQMEMLRADGSSRQHRRISSMDHRFQHSRPASPSRLDQNALHQQLKPDSDYDHLHSKRLDLEQEGEPKHRRAHSDVGILYKPVSTAIVAPQLISRPSQGSLPKEIISSPQAPPFSQPSIEYRQNGQFSHGQQRPSLIEFSREIEEPWLKHNNSNIGPSMNREAFLPPFVVKESKARLQFILNDDPSSPEDEHRSSDHTQRPQSPEVTEWNRPNPAIESTQRAHALHTTHSDQSHIINEFAIQDHQEARPASQAPPMSSINPARRQISKKQKLSQDMTNRDPITNNGAEEYEYHMRQSLLHSQARASPHIPQQRPPFPGDRWPQQGPAQQHPQQPSASMQSQSQSSPGPPPTNGRRVGEGPKISHQQSGHQFPGSDVLQHGLSMGRPPHPEHYNAPGHGGMMETPRPMPGQISHSRHSSLSKPGPGPGPGSGPGSEQLQHQGPIHSNSRIKGAPSHNSGPAVEQYPRSNARLSPGAVPGQPRPAPPSQHQPPYQSSPAQQPQINSSMASRKKMMPEHQSGPYGPPQGGAPSGFEQRQSAPQNVHLQHQQQQQHHHQQQQAMQQQHQHQHPHLQHSYPSRHQEQEIVHEKPAPSLYKQSQRSGQVRVNMQEPAPIHPGQGYYEQDPQFGSNRSTLGSQSHQQLSQERQSATHGHYHSSPGPHDPSYRPYPGNNTMRSSASMEHPQNEEYMRAPQKFTLLVWGTLLNMIPAIVLKPHMDMEVRIGDTLMHLFSS
ncbi:Dcp1p-Dcp2p decapping enzyme complex alpha subunit [Linnemannia zychae]|nr:Dcp1p-Dcp2p decapping enzyme complex alpha subunit [Linnemannia zychae]